jgi:hypothetical protein
MRLRLVADLKELRRAWAELFERADADEAASYELAASARRFSRHTKEAVEDKLNFTATLVRAGEVDAANRLFAEFEQEVLDEEAALFEKVNEVRVAQAIRRERITRLRLARTLAACFVGSALIASSAFASVIVNAVTDDGPSASAPAVAGFASITDPLRQATQAGNDVRKVRVAGIKIRMNPNQLREFRQLTDGQMNAGKLQQFLMGILPAPLAEQVQEALVYAATTLEAPPVEAEVAEEVKIVEETKKANETEATDQPDAEPTPEPSPSGDDGQKKKKGSRDRSGGGDGDDEGDDPGSSPLPDISGF